MSLVGNLEDLSLGDILQIISLSQKSGVLALASDHGTGRIVFRAGLVQAACLKGGPQDLGELLVSGGFIDAASYEAFEASSRELGVDVCETLASETGLTSDRIENMIRESAEAAVFAMFTWPSGDFSFDVRGELEPDDPRLVMSTGINAQFLAMEGLRLWDELARDQEKSDPSASGFSAEDASGIDLGFVDDPLGEEGPAPNGNSVPQTATDALVSKVVERAETLDDLEEVSPILPPVSDAQPVATRVVAAIVQEATAQEGGDALRASNRRTPVVLIDPDVTVLEWVKAAIEDDFERVHVFQQAEQGLSRIRQYLIRGVVPLVIIAPDAPIDPLSGIHGLADFAKRLKAQAPKLVVLGLREAEEGDAVAMPSILDGVVSRPSRAQVADRSGEGGQGTQETLRNALFQILTEGALGVDAPSQNVDASSGSASHPRSKQALADAETEAIARLQEASSRGEVMPVVLDFAAEIFTRVAILIVRDEDVFAIAGRGIPSLEVDPLSEAPAVSIERMGPGIIRSVIESNCASTAMAETPADLDLLCRLGVEEALPVYVAPIESGTSVIALLYGDQATSDQPIPETDGLVAVLQEAGLALDRAALERALWEADAVGN